MKRILPSILFLIASTLVYADGHKNPYTDPIESFTEAQLKTKTPGKAGQLFYDSTNKAIVVSTGTTQAAFGIIYDGTAQPTGW